MIGRLPRDLEMGSVRGNSAHILGECMHTHILFQYVFIKKKLNSYDPNELKQMCARV